MMMIMMMTEFGSVVRLSSIGSDIDFAQSGAVQFGSNAELSRTQSTD